MKFHKIKSFAKVNLTLKILNKYSNGYHKIESLISKINLADEILIKEIQGSKKQNIVYWEIFLKYFKYKYNFKTTKNLK